MWRFIRGRAEDKLAVSGAVLNARVEFMFEEGDEYWESGFMGENYFHYY